MVQIGISKLCLKIGEYIVWFWCSNDEPPVIRPPRGGSSTSKSLTEKQKLEMFFEQSSWKNHGGIKKNSDLMSPATSSHRDHIHTPGYTPPGVYNADYKYDIFKKKAEFYNIMYDRGDLSFSEYSNFLGAIVKDIDKEIMSTYAVPNMTLTKNSKLLSNSMIKKFDETGIDTWHH